MGVAAPRAARPWHRRPVRFSARVQGQDLLQLGGRPVVDDAAFGGALIETAGGRIDLRAVAVHGDRRAVKDHHHPVTRGERGGVHGDQRVGPGPGVTELVLVAAPVIGGAGVPENQARVHSGGWHGPEGDAQAGAGGLGGDQPDRLLIRV